MWMAIALMMFAAVGHAGKAEAESIRFDGKTAVGL